MTNKKTVVVLFGGQSSEHSVSRVSATTVISHLNEDEYYVLLVGITPEGKWMLYNGPVEHIKTGEWEKYGIPTVISPDASQKGLIKMVGDKAKVIPVDVVFPVLHGLYGEDGSIQGLLELAGIPYVGCGILASSLSMDKVYTKIIAKAQNIDQAKYVVVHRKSLGNIDEVVTNIEKELGYPCFIKPSNAGSSVGITKAHNQEELKEGLRLAAAHDRKLLVEEEVIGREVECAILGNDAPKASAVGEIIPAAEFYDFDAKYNNDESKTIIPAQLSKEVTEEVREKAKRIFQAVDGAGLSRVDFFVEKDTDRVIFNEINTLPGFTSISMYPMLWEQEGYRKEELIDALIELALEQEEE